MSGSGRIRRWKAALQEKQKKQNPISENEHA
jgi:hypothetical protein